MSVLPCGTLELCHWLARRVARRELLMVQLQDASSMQRSMLSRVERNHEQRSAVHGRRSRSPKGKKRGKLKALRRERYVSGGTYATECARRVLGACCDKIECENLEKFSKSRPREVKTSREFMVERAATWHAARTPRPDPALFPDRSSFPLAKTGLSPTVSGPGHSFLRRRCWWVVV